MTSVNLPGNGKGGDTTNKECAKGGEGNFCNSGWESEEKIKEEENNTKDEHAKQKNYVADMQTDLFKNGVEVFNTDKTDMSAKNISSGECFKKVMEDVGNDKSKTDLVPLVNEDEDFFEGVEKLLEVWFTVNKKKHHEVDCGLLGGGLLDCDLRNIPRASLDDMLTSARCEIISFTSNSMVDAYMLSESSMFISKRRFILKTCGTTTPLDCLEKLMWLVQKYTGYQTIEDIFYSRKNYTRPDLQLTPYRSFEQEVDRLDKVFLEGAAYCMGTLNRDCWYIYTLNPMDHYVHGRENTEQDQTLEILMSDLDEKVMHTFYKKNSKDAKEATEKSGIHKIIPKMKIDDFLFDPCGYSMNGVLSDDSGDSGNGEYMTIHITPERAFSYVSFETNIPAVSYMDIIKQVLDTFLPGKLVLTFYATRTSTASSFHQELKKSLKINDWRRNDIQFCSFQDCDLTYSHFFKPAS